MFDYLGYITLKTCCFRTYVYIYSFVSIPYCLLRRTRVVRTLEKCQNLKSASLGNPNLTLSKQRFISNVYMPSVVLLLRYKHVVVSSLGTQPSLYETQHRLSHRLNS